MATEIDFVSRPIKTERTPIAVNRATPQWLFWAFAIAMVIAYLGSTFAVYGVHGDYDSFTGRNPDSPFYFVEAWQLLSVARPVAVWVSNIPLYPMSGIEDFPWARLFGMLALCVIGIHMISICVSRLRVRPFDALALAIVAFLAPAFAVSIMNIAAWGPYQTAVWFAFCAYSFLSVSNKQLFLFSSYATARQYRGVIRHVWHYITRWHFGLAFLFFQIAMYDYPSNALFFCLLPAIALLFSQSPFLYRALIACRDIVFLGANLVIYFLTTKLIYFPILKANYPVRVFPDTGYTSYYRFELQRDPLAFLARLSEQLRVGGNLWFLPQSHVYIAVAMIVLGGLWLAQSRFVPSSTNFGSQLARLKIKSAWSEGAFIVGIVAICYFVSGSPILLSIGGIVDYRTIAAPTALTAVIFLFMIGGIAEILEVRVPSLNALPWSLPRIAIIAVLISAVGITADHIRMTVRLSVNEFAYVTSLIRHAAETDHRTLVILDQRDVFPPNDLPVAYDQKQRAIMPYQLGCFSSYCFSQPEIYAIARRQLGYANTRIAINIFRGDEAQGLTCASFAAPDSAIPPALSAETTDKIKEIQKRGGVDCVPFDLVWHDIALSPDTWDRR